MSHDPETGNEAIPSGAEDSPLDFIQATNNFLSGLERICGLRIVLHDYAFLTQGRLPYARYQHTCAYCQAVKQQPDGQRLCHQSDVVEAGAEARKIRRPFWRRCHAGVSEVIVPILRGDDLIAVAFCGQAFEPDQTGMRSIPAKIRRAMPKFDRDHLMTVGRLVDIYFRTNQLAVEGLTDLQRASQFGPRKLMETLFWLEKQLNSQISVKEAAHYAGLSLSHFEHLFKRHIGVSFREWRLRRRLRAAKYLLVKTNLKVREIAAKVGYEDPAYFHRLFRRAEGMSPRFYRAVSQAAQHSANKSNK